MDETSPQRLAPNEPHRKRRLQSFMSAESAESPREMGSMRKRRDTGAASFVGSGSGIHFVRTVRQAFARNSGAQSSNEEAVDDELVPGEDDRLQSQNFPGLLWRADEVLFANQGQQDNPQNPTFEDLVRWTKPYFDSWHPPFPFLHAPTFLGSLEKASIHTLSGTDYSESVLIRSVVSISRADQRQMPHIDDHLAPAHLLYTSIEDALSALQPLLIHPSSVPTLQAVVSIQLFLISMLRLNAASRVGGLVVRMSYHLGLHRCPSRFAQFSSTEVEIRRRLFWSIYCIERYLSHALGLPLDLKDDDLDVCFPDREFHSSGGAISHVPNPSTGRSLHYVQVLKCITSPNETLGINRLVLPTTLAKHGRIKGLILELRNKSILHSRTDPEEVSHIDAEISRWWNDAQEVLDPVSIERLTTSDGQMRATPMLPPDSIPVPSLSSSHKLLVLVQKHESVILLYRPVITSGYNTPAHTAAMQKCIGASKAIVSNVYRHINSEMKHEGSQNGRISNPLCWPGFVWMVWQSGLILLYAAFEGHYSVQIAQREADCCVAILENLSLRGNFWPSACAAAIKELQISLDEKAKAESQPGSMKNGPRQAESLTPGLARSQTSSSALPTASATDRVDRDPTQQFQTASGLNDFESPPQVPLGLQASLYNYGTEAFRDRNQNSSFTSHNGNQHARAHRSDALNSSLPQSGLQSHQMIDMPTHSFYNSGGFWPALNAEVEGTFHGVDDIFQLIDVPYLLADDLSHLPPELPGINGYATL